MNMILRKAMPDERSLVLEHILKEQELLSNDENEINNSKIEMYKDISNADINVYDTGEKTKFFILSYMDTDTDGDLLPIVCSFFLHKNGDLENYESDFDFIPKDNL